MDQPRLRHVACLSPAGVHRMAYWEWGDPASRDVVVCVHGLTRQGRDFDTLARTLAGSRRVVCPDVVGRGRSEWLREPAHYGVPQYVADMVTLLARLDVEQVDWVGTSMGGLIGMALAAQGGGLVRRLVLNDVGPRVEPAFSQRLLTYLGRPAFWRSEQEAADALWAISQGFGPHTPEQWLALTQPQLKPAEQDGVAGFTYRYDPAIAVPIRAMTPEFARAAEALLWQAWDRIAAPTLLLRGELSDLLAPETAAAMATRGPRAQVHTVAGVGHAPTLVAPDQQAVVRDFLLSP